MKKTLEVLNQLETDGVLGRYAIGGAMAATFFVEPLLTFDLDVFVVLPETTSGLLSLGPLYGELRKRGYAEEAECVLIEGVPVQFLPTYNALLEEALREAIQVPYEDVLTRVLRAEHLVAVCLQTGRSKDRERVRLLREEAALDVPSPPSHIGPPSPPCEMGPMDRMNVDPASIARIARAKEARRRHLASLSYPEKVAIVMRLQQMATPILRRRGRHVQPWQTVRHHETQPAEV